VDKKPRPAIIVADVRAGGHLLTCALSNHPQIFCVREEPLHRKSVWRLVPLKVVLAVILQQRYYEVSMCKLTASHILRPAIWKQVVDYKPSLRVLYLERENLMEQVASDVINNMHLEGHPTHTMHTMHTFEQPALPPVTLKPKDILASSKGILQRRVEVRRRLKSSKLPVLYLTYEELTAGAEVSCLPKKVTDKICTFLEVDCSPLCTNMRKVHSKPYSEFVSNWDEICTIRLG